MSVYWLSWWDPPTGEIGKETAGIQVWITGERADDAQSCCALVEAESEEQAWSKADRYYPGAAKAERRFSQEKPDGWRPPVDRFPDDRSKA